MLTGDAAVNADAPIICATAGCWPTSHCGEGADTDVGLVCMDEFHYYGDRDRGWSPWQVPLIELTGAQFLLMSATLGDTAHRRRSHPTHRAPAAAVVAGGERPVPLEFEYVTTPIHPDGRGPAEPGQGSGLHRPSHAGRGPWNAQALMSLNVCTREEKRAIAEQIGAFASPPDSAAP